MSSIATTKMSSKGQVVIPEEIREQLGLVPGVQFVVVGERDVVMLKIVSAPAMDRFSDLLDHARSQAKKARLKKADIAKAIKKTRNRS